jgi:hypothetical protein
VGKGSLIAGDRQPVNRDLMLRVKHLGKICDVEKMSALALKADMCGALGHFYFGSKAAYAVQNGMSALGQ